MHGHHLSTSGHRAENRYQFAQVLSEHHIPYVIWFEDALLHYGVPTLLLDLYILVSDIYAVSELLTRAGWVVDTERPHRIGNVRVDCPQQPLLSPDSRTRTVLLPAIDWNYHLAAGPSLKRVSMGGQSPRQAVTFPHLSGFLDALIESWLDCPSKDAMLLIYMASQISNLYTHAAPLKQLSFAEKLKYEHRQFHYDALAGMTLGTPPFRKHQRTIRDALARGQYQLQECSVSRDNEEFFGTGNLAQ